MQADFVKLRKRFKAQTGSKEVLEKQCKALQELCGKQRLEMDALTDDASQSGQCCKRTDTFNHSQPTLHVCNVEYCASIMQVCAPTCD